MIAYSDPKADGRHVPGLLDDYAFTAAACLDAYEITGDMSYFQFGRTIVDAMIERFHDTTGGGFFDTEQSAANDPVASLGALQTRRKPFQDSPIPAGNSAAAAVLLRLHSLHRTKLPITKRPNRRWKSLPVPLSSMESTRPHMEWRRYGCSTDILR